MQKDVQGAVDAQVLEQMFKAGVHYGYGRSRRHPSVLPFIFGNKNKTDIIDLEKTNMMLEEAAAFVTELASKGKVLLFVGTKPEAKLASRKGAQSVGMPFVTERWIGGTISNFVEIKKRIAELETYNKDLKTGGLDKYTKKERVMMAKKMEKLSKYYSGLLELKKIPDALFVIDPKGEHIAVTEAMKQGVPVIAVSNSDSNIKGLDYPILGNDATVSSITFFMDAITAAYKKGSSGAKAA